MNCAISGTFPQTKPKRPHPRVKFTPEEDQRLTQLVQEYGEDSWAEIVERMPKRNLRQCKERWTNYLSPTLVNSPWTEQEDMLLISLRDKLGAKWVKIAMHFKNRTDTAIKNRWMILVRKYRRSHSNQHNEQQIQPGIGIIGSQLPLQIPQITQQPIHQQFIQSQTQQNLISSLKKKDEISEQIGSLKSPPLVPSPPSEAQLFPQSFDIDSPDFGITNSNGQFELSDFYLPQIPSESVFDLSW